MATYLILNTAVLGAMFLILWRLRWLHVDRHTALTSIVLILLTALFDTLMINAHLFTYSQEKISGIMIGAAPIEDFFYAIAAGIVIPSVWKGLKNQHE